MRAFVQSFVLIQRRTGRLADRPAPNGMKQYNSRRPSIWQTLGLLAIGIALCLTELYVGVLFLVFGFISLWYYFHPPKPPNIQEWFPPAKREVETPTMRLRQEPIQIPTRYQTGLVDSRRYYCKAGIAPNQPVWMLAHESGEVRHMCGSCRDSLIVDRRRRG